MIISWIKKLFVKTSPVVVVPEALEESLPRKPKEQSRLGRPPGSKNKGVSVLHLKKRPKRRVHETITNYKKRLERWDIRNDKAKANSNQRPNRPRVSSRSQKDPDQP
jgi:hypothetical protein